VLQSDEYLLMNKKNGEEEYIPIPQALNQRIDNEISDRERACAELLSR
jgi:hypothetical protein